MNDKCLSSGTARVLSRKFRTNFIPIRYTRSRHVSCKRGALKIHYFTRMHQARVNERARVRKNNLHERNVHNFTAATNLRIRVVTRSKKRTPSLYFLAWRRRICTFDSRGNDSYTIRDKEPYEFRASERLSSPRNADKKCSMRSRDTDIGKTFASPSVQLHRNKKHQERDKTKYHSGQIFAKNLVQSADANRLSLILIHNI